MDIPNLRQPDRYVGLYILEFEDYCSVGFTAGEVAELLDSEKYKDTKVYKIHKAYPNGTLEIKGVSAQTFQLEAGLFFYATDIDTAGADFKRLTDSSVSNTPPCRAKLHLAKYSQDNFVTALIFPAEYNDEISNWLLINCYKTTGAAEGGIEATQRYYDQAPEILQKNQLFAKNESADRSGMELLNSLKKAVQR